MYGVLSHYFGQVLGITIVAVIESSSSVALPGGLKFKMLLPLLLQRGFFLGVLCSSKSDLYSSVTILAITGWQSII